MKNHKKKHLIETFISHSKLTSNKLPTLNFQSLNFCFVNYARRQTEFSRKYKILLFLLPKFKYACLVASFDIVSALFFKYMYSSTDVSFIYNITNTEKYVAWWFYGFAECFQARSLGVKVNGLKAHTINQYIFYF